MAGTAPYLPLDLPLYVTTRLSTSSQQRPLSLPIRPPLLHQLLPLKQPPQLPPLHRPNRTHLMHTITLLPIALGTSSKLPRLIILMHTPLRRRVKPKRRLSITRASSTIRRDNNNTPIPGTSTPPKHSLPLPPLPMPRPPRLNPRRRYPRRTPASSVQTHKHLAHVQ